MPSGSDSPRAAGEPVSHPERASDLNLDNAFWRFSLAVYASRGVAQECLALQETLNVDVNLLLFCAWMGAQRRALGPSQVEAAGAAIAVWHSGVVRSLRGVRQQIKSLARDDFEPFRSQVKSLELKAEQIEQAILFSHAQAIETANTGGEPREMVAENIRAYLDSLAGDRANSADSLSVARLVEAARRQIAG
jgi:uncharacterized protein (TIGR02444 family)